LNNAQGSVDLPEADPEQVRHDCLGRRLAACAAAPDGDGGAVVLCDQECIPLIMHGGEWMLGCKRCQFHLAAHTPTLTPRARDMTQHMVLRPCLSRSHEIQLGYRFTINVIKFLQEPSDHHSISTDLKRKH
jgi:hypothetical protein